MGGVGLHRPMSSDRTMVGFGGGPPSPDGCVAWRFPVPARAQVSSFGGNRVPPAAVRRQRGARRVRPFAGHDAISAAARAQDNVARRGAGGRISAPRRRPGRVWALARARKCRCCPVCGTSRAEASAGVGTRSSTRSSGMGISRHHRRRSSRSPCAIWRVWSNMRRLASYPRCASRASATSSISATLEPR